MVMAWTRGAWREIDQAKLKMIVSIDEGSKERSFVKKDSPPWEADSSSEYPTLGVVFDLFDYSHFMLWIYYLDINCEFIYFGLGHLTLNLNNKKISLLFWKQIWVEFTEFHFQKFILLSLVLIVTEHKIKCRFFKNVFFLLVLFEREIM